MKIGIYGGTFNPPHIGHIYAAQAAVEKLDLDRLLIIPAGQPPHKTLPEGSPEGEMRLALVRLAFEKVPQAEVLDIEMTRGGKSYTADTVSELKKMYPADELYLLMGTDMFMSLDSWYDAEKIMSCVTPAVFERREGDYPGNEERAKFYAERYGIRPEVIDIDAIPVSSTQLREDLPNRGGTEYLMPEVYGFILENRLYGVKANFDYLRFHAYKMLNTKRMQHVCGCEQEAVRLGKRWGENVDLCREAAILHDITKKSDGDEQLILCEKYGIMTDNLSKGEYKILHAKTGAAVARELFAVCDEVYEAISWHTTGKDNMTLLEKIIYMADYIEANRDFDGLEKLRRLAYEDIDKAMILGLEMSMEDIRSRGITPNADSLRALDYLKANI